MFIPTTKPDATREDYVLAWMECFGDSREEAEEETQLHIDLGLFKPYGEDVPDVPPPTWFM